jgi:hypothetical protein
VEPVEYGKKVPVDAPVTVKSPWVALLQVTSAGMLQLKVNDNAVTVALLPERFRSLLFCQRVAAVAGVGTIANTAKSGSANHALRDPKTCDAEARAAFGSATSENLKNFISCSSILLVEFPFNAQPSTL